LGPVSVSLGAASRKKNYSFLPFNGWDRFFKPSSCRLFSLWEEFIGALSLVFVAVRDTKNWFDC